MPRRCRWWPEVSRLDTADGGVGQSLGARGPWGTGSLFEHVSTLLSARGRHGKACLDLPVSAFVT